ncbi:hypothetical protein SAMN04488116_3499 [Flagellimonas flava]|uniref:Nitroimidazol reductase NimA, pyridoxamine 5'-phosphate oxidase superfamily n=2 Tax=Flagellimonas flava TaxID=570519 RepID=A0A1M5Q4Z0_9FLAO|nr:hypothetical protein SAMN04488116_3499 [Allomuricauda flava]
MTNSIKTKIKRVPKNAVYELERINDIIDNNFICHVGFIHNSSPVVIPTMYGRKENFIFIHGASVSRLIKNLEKGVEICIAITKVKALVLARSAFNHTLNYESVVFFGKGNLVAESDKLGSLKVISDHVLKHRWEEVRMPNQKELKATKVIRIEIDESSAKVRSGDPQDSKSDYSLDVWAGVLPISNNFEAPIADAQLKKNIGLPKSIEILFGNGKQ